MMGLLRLCRIQVVLVALAAFTAILVPGTARADTSSVETAWRLLDYVAVDYGGAVENGRIKSTTEYAEMTEFSASVATRLAALPLKPERQRLIDGAATLRQAIASKSDPQRIATLAHGLAASLLAAYPVPLAPANAPDIGRGATLFAQNCAACHGMSGDGHGPNAATLDTPPIAFTDAERARKRSVFALYQVISQGIDGTAMASFDDLPAADRWALADYAGHFAFSDAEARKGEALWKSDPAVRKLIPDLKTLVDTTPQMLAKSIGRDEADALMAYLRRHPDAVVAKPSGSLDLVRSRLAESLDAYKAGNVDHASELALSAYLDGFEPVEPTLGARDATLLATIEGAMGEYRAALQRGVPVEDAASRVAALDSLFVDADNALAPSAASGLTTFVGAASILLREGLEALLIVVAMIAFVRKAERPEVLPYVHGGWIGALVAGFATWLVATYAIGISGASRELTEGFGSLFAAVVLLSVGIWMHGKAQADRWQHYIHTKMAKALSGSSAWFLFGLAFVVVYREVFETILFYAALWTPGNGAMLLAGMGTAIVALAGIAWAMLRYSRQLPIATFFKYSAWLMAVLTVVLAGKGVAALQEAGIIDIAPLMAAPRIALLGVFPTVQSLATQLLMLAAIVLGFTFNQRRSSRKPVI